MHVTVIADASWCHRYKVGGYGYWVASNRGKMGGGGKFDGYVDNATLAEMIACVNGVRHGVKDELIWVGDSILIQTDCTGSIERFNGLHLKVGSPEKRVVFSLDRLVTKYSLDLKFKHVKGHTLIKDARHITNKMCDRRAKYFMRQARDEYRNVVYVRQ